MSPLALTLALALPVPGREAPSLEARLAPVVRAHRGRAAVLVRHLVTGEEWLHGADVPMPAASLLRLPILIEAYLQAEERRVGLDRPAQARVPAPSGKGTPRHAPTGVSVSFREGVRRMVVLADDEATALVAERVGVQAVHQRLRGWGHRRTRIEMKPGPGRAAPSLQGQCTAGELAALLEEINAGRHFRPPLKQSLLGYLRKAPRTFAKGVIPPEADAALLTDPGPTPGVAGILFTPSGPVVFCVLAFGSGPPSGTESTGGRLCSRITRLVVDHFLRSDRPQGSAKPERSQP